MAKVKLYYEVTPPSKWSTRWELEHTVRLALDAGAEGIDVTDSPTGESHSSSVAASVYIKLNYSTEVLCHIRTRDVTPMGLRSLVRACSVWCVDSILFILGEGGESTGLTSTKAVELVRRERLLDDRPVKLGLIVDPRRPLGLDKKLAAKPDFVYAAPVVSTSEAEFLKEVVDLSDAELYSGVFVNSAQNAPIMQRIGLSLDSTCPVDWGLVDTLKNISSAIVIMSPADTASGLATLKEAKERVL